MKTIRISAFAAFACLGMAANVKAQAACDGRVVGTLGISSFECRDCSFSSNPAGLSGARFGTEPRLLAVDQDAAGGDDLERDDVLVAADGNLITTAAGVRVLTTLRPGQTVQLRVRREGRVRDLRMVAGEACISRPPVPAVVPSAPRAEAAPPPPSPAAVPSASQASAPPVPVAALPPVPPRPRAASLGFSFRCSDCGIVAVPTTGGSTGRWRFAEPPVVDAVDRDGPAWAAGLRAGDAILAVDDLPLTTADGGRRFYRIRSGETVAFTVRRDGRERVVRIEAAEPPSRDPSVLAVPQDRRVPNPAPATPETTLRYTGTIGDTAIEVRGAPVTVSEDTATGETIIRSADLEVRLKRRSGAR